MAIISVGIMNKIDEKKKRKKKQNRNKQRQRVARETEAKVKGWELNDFVGHLS